MLPSKAKAFPPLYWSFRDTQYTDLGALLASGIMCVGAQSPSTMQRGEMQIQLLRS